MAKNQRPILIFVCIYLAVSAILAPWVGQIFKQVISKMDPVILGVVTIAFLILAVVGLARLTIWRK